MRNDEPATERNSLLEQVDRTLAALRRVARLKGAATHADANAPLLATIIPRTYQALLDMRDALTGDGGR